MAVQFTLSEKEEQDYKDFIEEHKKLGHAGISITFIPTNIATAVVIKCTSCDKDKNITDFNIW